MSIKLNSKELATILCGLRSLQKQVGQYDEHHERDGAQWIEDEFPNQFFENYLRSTQKRVTSALGLDEIDELAQRIHADSVRERKVQNRRA